MNASNENKDIQSPAQGKIAVLLAEAERLQLEAKIHEIQSRLIIIRANFNALTRSAARLAWSVEMNDANNAKNEAEKLRSFLAALGMDPDTGQKLDAKLNTFKVA